MWVWLGPSIACKGGVEMRHPPFQAVFFGDILCEACLPLWLAGRAGAVASV